MNNRRVVVTGMGALTPIGLGLKAFSDGLFAGVSGANLITQFDASKFKTRFACELKGFEVGNYLDKKEARRMDPFTQYSMIVANEAIADANFDHAKIDKTRFGVVMGSGVGGMQVFTQEVGEIGRASCRERV